MIRWRLAHLLLDAGLVVALLVPERSFALDPDVGTVRTGNPDSPPPLQEPPPPVRGAPGDVFSLPPPPELPDSMPGTAGGAAYPIDNIVFSGNRVIPGSALEALSDPLLHHSATSTELGLLAQRISLYYFEHGYVNSGVAALELNATTATLTVRITEGHLTRVHVEGNGGLDERYIVMRLRTSDDETLNVDVLRERFQILLNDPLIDAARAQLESGAKPGESVLNVSIDRGNPYDLTIFLNNYHPVSTGANALGISGTVRNVTGWGDTLNGTVQAEVLGASGLSGSIDWHLPFDASGGEVYLAVDTSNDSVVEQSLAPLDIQSRLNDSTIGVRHFVFQGLQEKMSVGIEALRRESRTWLLDVPFSFTPGTSNGRIVDTGLRVYDEYGLRTENQSLTTRIAFTDARNDLVDEGGFLADTIRIPNEQRVLLLQGQYAHLMGSDGDQVVGHVTLQRTDRPLDPLNQIGVGGVLTVRGFLENELVRDNGTVFNLEYQHVLTAGGVRTTLAPFFDWGSARNEGQASTDISSAGLATSFSWKQWRFDLVLAHRLIHPVAATPSGGSLQAAGIEMQLTYSPLR